MNTELLTVAIRINSNILCKPLNMKQGLLSMRSLYGYHE